MIHQPPEQNRLNPVVTSETELGEKRASSPRGSSFPRRDDPNDGVPSDVATVRDIQVGEEGACSSGSVVVWPCEGVGGEVGEEHGGNVEECDESKLLEMTDEGVLV